MRRPKRGPSIPKRRRPIIRWPRRPWRPAYIFGPSASGAGGGYMPYIFREPEPPPAAIPDQDEPLDPSQSNGFHLDEPSA